MYFSHEVSSKIRRLDHLAEKIACGVGVFSLVCRGSWNHCKVCNLAIKRLIRLGHCCAFVHSSVLNERRYQVKLSLLFGSSEIKINRMFTHRSAFLYDAEPQSLLCSVELRALFSAAELVVESRENRSHFGSSSAPAEWRIGALRSPSGAGSPRRRALRIA